jgi:hypothetical protein
MDNALDDAFKAYTPLRAPFGASYTMDDPLHAAMEHLPAPGSMQEFFGQTISTQTSLALSNTMETMSNRALPDQAGFDHISEIQYLDDTSSHLALVPVSDQQRKLS